MEQILLTRIKPQTFVGEKHNPWYKWRNHIIMIHPLIQGSVVLADLTDAPLLTNLTVINLYLHACVLCAVVKIMAAFYKLLQNIWQEN